MKKQSLFKVMFASIGVMLGFTACNTCMECTTSVTNNGTTISNSNTYCKYEYETSKAWKQRLESYEEGDNTSCDNL